MLIYVIIILPVNLLDIQNPYKNNIKNGKNLFTIYVKYDIIYIQGNQKMNNKYYKYIIIFIIII